MPVFFKQTGLIMLQAFKKLLATWQAEIETNCFLLSFSLWNVFEISLIWKGLIPVTDSGLQVNNMQLIVGLLALDKWCSLSKHCN